MHDKGDRLCKNQFVACFRVRMFQKRLRTAGELGVEFVAAGVVHISQYFSCLYYTNSYRTYVVISHLYEG